jgi:hypothetical protein
MRSALCLLVLLALAGCGADTVPAAPAADALANVRWEDHVRDCSIEQGGPGQGTIIGDVVKGDVTRDGRVDTLVVDECRSPTSSWPQAVEVFDGASDPAKPTRIATLLDGDERYLRDLKVEVTADGSVVITSNGVSESAPHCCPDLVARDVFRYVDGKFVHAESSASPATSPSSAGRRS